jgi:tRNA pseudouridine55 synthase
MNGLLVIDKPLGLTSREAVNRVQGLLPRGTKVGHTGTLDPLATGVLVLCLGQATRLAEYVQRQEKVYRAGLRLGGRSTSDDAEGAIVWEPSPRVPSLDTVRETINHFVGEIEQMPPAFSAAKVDGRRAYELARRGKDVDLTPRRVTIHAIEVIRYEFPHLELEVRCGKGTYIRSLARDLGERLRCGAFLEALRRTRVGGFRVEEAAPLDNSELLRSLLPIARAVDGLPRWSADVESLRRFRHGQVLPLVAGAVGDEVAVLTPDGELGGVGLRTERGLAPTLVLPALPV